MRMYTTVPDVITLLVGNKVDKRAKEDAVRPLPVPQAKLFIFFGLWHYDDFISFFCCSFFYCQHIFFPSSIFLWCIYCIYVHMYVWSNMSSVNRTYIDLYIRGPLYIFLKYIPDPCYYLAYPQRECLFVPKRPATLHILLRCIQDLHAKRAPHSGAKIDDITLIAFHAPSCYIFHISTNPRQHFCVHLCSPEL